MTKVFIDLTDIDANTTRFIDTRFNLADSKAGFVLFQDGHVEGAVYWDLEKDLSNMEDVHGRHPMISKEKMTELIQSAGLSLDDQIVIYDQGAVPFSLRAYFLLEWAGFKNVKVLRQGFEEIKQALPITKKITYYDNTKVVPSWNDNILLNMDDVREVVKGNKEGQLIDARAAARFRGEIEPIDPVAGHIPTAINYDWEQLKQGSTFLDKDSLTAKLSDLTNKKKPVIAYCGSGVTAAPLYASLKEAGYEDVKLYVGSYSDWIRENEIETSI
ncbi:sulfurtransferase [uncultured Psychrobacillus sp.]|uniref:sulfurtransferase n=1 Tax=uncultured Psychrobacillus sp. TaxID=1551585 RepID=UPI0026034546|nr:sulfurtransferase [uncultured Psychrobacillus sp.]